jgi:hypothetical protein
MIADCPPRFGGVAVADHSRMETELPDTFDVARNVFCLFCFFAPDKTDAATRSKPGIFTKIDALSYEQRVEALRTNNQSYTHEELLEMLQWLIILPEVSRPDLFSAIDSLLSADQSYFISFNGMNFMNYHWIVAQRFINAGYSSSAISEAVDIVLADTEGSYTQAQIDTANKLHCILNV